MGGGERGGEGETERVREKQRKRGEGGEQNTPVSVRLGDERQTNPHAVVLAALEQTETTDPTPLHTSYTLPTRFMSHEMHKMHKRSVAMQVYYAQKKRGRGNYTEDVTALAETAPLGPRALNGTCTGVPSVAVNAGGATFVASVRDTAGRRVATVTEDRYLLVSDTTS